MNTEVRDLIEASEDSGAAASALVRWAREDPHRLSVAAAAWLEARSRLRTCHRYGDGRSIARLLVSLTDASAEYRELLPRLDRDKSPSQDDIELLTLLAPARAAPTQWRQLLLAWVEAGNGHPTTVLHSFGERMPGLAYELLSSMEARTPGGDEAKSAATALAVYRYGLQPSFAHETSRVAMLTADGLLSDDRIFWFTMMALEAKRPGPPVLGDALALAFAHREDRPTRFVRGLQLLRAQGKREDLIDLLCHRMRAEPSMIPKLVGALSEAGHRLFFGWGKDTPLLGRLGRTLLEAGTWPSGLWSHTLREKFLGGDPIEKREVAILAESLLLIAEDVSVPLGVRRTSLEALSMTGVGRMAMRLGKLRAHSELAEEWKRARNHLSRTRKGHEVDPENGLRLALNHMLGHRRLVQ